MSEGAGAVAQAAADGDPDGGAPDGTALDGPEPFGPPGPQAAARLPTARISAQGPARDRVRGMATA
jgi:hypothetical protein